MQFRMILAHDDKFGIGKDNDIPWSNSEDLKNFKAITSNSICICGYKTFESIYNKTNGKMLPNRTLFVLTNKTIELIPLEYLKSNIHFMNRTQLNKVIQLLDKTTEHGIINVIGGAEIYKMFLPYSKFIYVSQIYGDYECDIFFEINQHKIDFQEIYKKENKTFMFTILENINLKEWKNE